jgi:hypothetical protein
VTPALVIPMVRNQPVELDRYFIGALDHTADARGETRS